MSAFCFHGAVRDSLHLRAIQRGPLTENNIAIIFTPLGSPSCALPSQIHTLLAVFGEGSRTSHHYIAPAFLGVDHSDGNSTERYALKIR